jgi:hypothetical protein
MEAKQGAVAIEEYTDISKVFKQHLFETLNQKIPISHFTFDSLFR